jgi:3-oxoacyl-[acyl-carrier-protein] synthase-3
MAGMELAVRTWARAVDGLGWTADAIDHFVIHQVSKVHTEQFAGILGIDMAKVFRLYPSYGNVGPAGVPIALSKLEQEGKLERGQRVALVGIGSGINCTMAEVVW